MMPTGTSIGAIAPTVPPVRLESFGLRGRLVQPISAKGHLHYHNEIELNYLFQGEVTYLFRWGRKKLTPGNLIAFWGIAPHGVVEAQPGSELAWITLPLPQVLSWGLPESFFRALLNGTWLAGTRLNNSSLPHLVSAWIHELADCASGQHEALMLEIQACLMRHAEQTTPSLPEPVRNSTSRGGFWPSFAKISWFISENFLSDITVAHIARAVHLHPKYAATVFRQKAGTTIKNFLLQHRIAHAQRQLLATDQKVIDIAMASGFHSVSAFYSAFAHLTGETPNGFRSRNKYL